LIRHLFALFFVFSRQFYLPIAMSWVLLAF